MKVLLLSTYEKTGGAAIAANRLMEALNNNGVKAKMLVRDKQTDRSTVVALPGQKCMRLRFLWERFVIWLRLHLQRKRLFEVDIANCGADITQLPDFQEADIIHLHWINQGMLSLDDIRRILQSGKRVVWTMHDIWPATAICHVALECRRYEEHCCHCRLLPDGGCDNDFAAEVWRRKERMLSGQHLTFVACSEWLASEARKSALLKGHTVVSIPNPIDTHIYHPTDKQKAREMMGLPAEGFVILFASQRVTNPGKGMQYLLEACQLLAQQYPEQKDSITVAVLGGHAEDIVGQLPFRTCTLGYVNDEQRIVAAYNATDVFVLPSLSENLPNTIMEAMACGTPCVGFNVGGIPEMIDHCLNGYVARYKDATDLADGISYVMANRKTMGEAAREKVLKTYSEDLVAKRYIKVYSL